MIGNALKLTMKLSQQSSKMMETLDAILCHSSMEDYFPRGVAQSSLRNDSAPFSITIPCLTHTGTECMNNYVVECVSM